MVTHQKARVVLILIRARNPSNIGAVARAMHDFGFSHLRIVNEYPVPFAAAKSAVHSSSVIEATTEHTSLSEAVSDCALVLGTTAVGDRKLDHQLHTLADAVPIIASTLVNSRNRVALLFGSEKTGLSNEELSHCHALLTIPMHTPATGGHLSMNLGQAAAVCLYALSESTNADVQPPSLGTADSHPPPAELLASSGDVERLTTLLQEVLDRSGYTRRHPANSRPSNVRRLVRRMTNTPGDSAVWSGVLRQLLHCFKE